MENPFFVAPPNILQALTMGVQGYDRARKGVKEQELKQSRQSALQRMAMGDAQGAFAETLGGGDTDAAKAVATFAESQSNRAFRESEAARQESQWKQSFGLQQSEAGRRDAQWQQTHDLQRQQIEGGKIPVGYRRAADGNLDPIPRGPADKPAADNFDPEQKLRKEFEGVAKPYLESRRGYERVLASKDDPAGDISLIFGYMKMLDPGSVVREGEFATAQNAAGIPDQIKNAYNRALQGTRLNSGQRNMFKGQAQSLYGGARKEFDTRADQFRGIAGQYNLNADRVLTPLAPVQAGAPSGGNIPAPPAGFKVVP